MAEDKFMTRIKSEHREGRYSWSIINREYYLKEVDIIPDWLIKLHVEWYEGYDNTPSFKAEVKDGVFDFANEPRWVRRPMGLWIAVHPDGRLRLHSHSGALAWDEAKQAWVSSQQEGYGRRSFEILMDPESDPNWAGGKNKVILRGPWHTLAPAGYSNVSVLEEKDAARGIYCFGLAVATDVLCRAWVRDFPNSDLAIVTYQYGKRSDTYMEPFKEGQTVPRGVETDRRVKTDRVSHRKYAN